MEMHAVTLVDHDLVIRLYWFKKAPDAPGSGSKVWYRMGVCTNNGLHHYYNKAKKSHKKTDISPTIITSD
jgi:hypothetical protein